MKKKSIIFGSIAAFTLTVVTVFAVANKPFTDVPQTHWAYDAIEKGRLSGLWQGYDDGTFGLGETVTREQVAVLLERNNEILKQEILDELSGTESGTATTDLESETEDEEDSDQNTSNLEGEKKHIFVTSNIYNLADYDDIPNVNGVSGADDICQTSAEEGGLSDNGELYLAWISDGDTWPEKRLNTDWDGLYVTTNGELIAEGWDDLTDGSIENPIMYTEFGSVATPAELSGDNVWTGTNANGTPTQEDCNEWVETGSMGIFGTAGHFDETDEKWSHESKHTCVFEARLYCVEQ